MEKLHPGARWLFRIRGYFGSLILLIPLIWVIGPILSILFSVGKGGVDGLLGAFLVGAFVYIVFIIVAAEIYARMAYNRWFYEFTPSSLKLERGIIWKRYSNVPYERVQNVDIHRGIFARILGFSTIDIQTAGFHYTGGRGRARSEGHIPAVRPEKAEKIREFLMKKISKKQGQGL